MGLVNRTLLLALILSLIGLREAVPQPPAASVDSVGINRWEHVKVEIFNQLSNKKDFHIHCKASDTRIGDMGEHVVGVGYNYGFTFKVNDFNTNQYFCDIWWPNPANRRTTWNTYAAERDLSRCPHYCMWQVNDDFLLGFKENDKNNPDIVISWK